MTENVREHRHVIGAAGTSAAPARTDRGAALARMGEKP